MAESKKFFKFKHNGKNVVVKTGEGTSDVYYKKDGGSNTYAKMKWIEKEGMFMSSNGSYIKYEDAEEKIRNML